MPILLWRQEVDQSLSDTPPVTRSVTLVKVALVLWLGVAMYLQLDQGLADQGDFTRAIEWFTPGPVGVTAHPSSDSPEFFDRYFHCYLPYWQFQTGGIRHALYAADWGRSSTVWLWFPGIVVNRVAYSNRVFYLPILSLLPRLLFFGCLLGLYVWIDARGGRHKLALLLLLGVPLALLLSTTDYLVYLNSFYQETGSMVYFGLWIASLLYLKGRPTSALRGLLCVAALTLLVCAKQSNLYWAPLGTMFLALAWRPWELAGRRILRLTALYVALTGGIICIYTAWTHRPDIFVHSYHGLFHGILTFSEDTSTRLAELGYADSASCVGVHVYDPIATAFLSRHGDRLSPLDALRVAWAEPGALLRMLKYAIDNLQDISLDDLGKFAPFDPRAPSMASFPKDAVLQRCWVPSSTSVLNVWSFVKFHAFPTGYAFLLTVGIYVAVFLAMLRREGFAADLGLIGLMTAVGCLIDPCLAICADGKSCLIKHFFLGNLLFDLATIAFVGAIGLAVLQRLAKGRELAVSGPNGALPAYPSRTEP
jgi:hypothetical protein